MKRTKAPRTGARPAKSRGNDHEPLAAGRKVRDIQNEMVGVILEHACQYAHPKADPVYNYLVRWEDGQVQALSESAFDGGNGFEIVD